MDTLPAGWTAFGSLSVEARAGQRVVYLGTRAETLPDARVSLIDWRTAPLTEAFLGVLPGDTWDGPGGEVRVHAKALLHDGVEWKAPKLDLPLRATRGVRNPLDVTLDPVQQRVVDLPPSTCALVLGEAGFGKTTVALRRLEVLAAQKGDSFRGAVLVPTEGLKRLTKQLLDRRAVRNTDVRTYDEWARELARRHFRLPHRESANASSRTMTLKRHRALIPTLHAMAAKHQGQTNRKDLLHLFGDTALLDEVLARAAGALHPATVKEVAEHTHQQFLDRSEREWAHVTDSTRLQALDGRELDSGTPQEDAESLDVEDYAVLFALEAERARLQQRHPKDLRHYDVIVVDEAQEFAPLELQLIGRTLRTHGSLLIAGDAAQQLDETTSFVSWDQVLADTGVPVPRFDRTTLAVNYRCPPDVTEFARGVLAGRFEPKGAHLHTLDGPHELGLLVTLIEQLRALTHADDTATAAVICRTAEQARTLHRWLSMALPVHLALHGDFRFAPGVLVTSVDEVKGLEFDYVFIHGAASETWHSTETGRRALYVAATRASWQLVLTTS